MTIDVKIGKIKILSVEEVIKNQLNEHWIIRYKKPKITYTDFVEVCQCSNEKDGCSEKDTTTPNSAYRSGAMGDFGRFLKNIMPIIYENIDGDYCVIKISKYLKKINDIDDKKCKNEQDQKRLQWFKFWCNRAVELYGDDAVMSFS
jgi:hypothetical protein